MLIEVVSEWVGQGLELEMGKAFERALKIARETEKIELAWAVETVIDGLMISGASRAVRQVMLSNLGQWPREQI